jgi:hypothetical protein
MSRRTTLQPKTYPTGEHPDVRISDRSRHERAEPAAGRYYVVIDEANEFPGRLPDPPVPSGVDARGWLADEPDGATPCFSHGAYHISRAIGGSVIDHDDLITVHRIVLTP